MNRHTQATVVIPQARSILFKLCKHFAKKIPVDIGDDHGHGLARFEWGDGEFQADGDTLVIHARADDDAALQRVQSVLDQHLALMRRRDPQPVLWTSVQLADERGAQNTL